MDPDHIRNVRDGVWLILHPEPAQVLKPSIEVRIDDIPHSHFTVSVSYVYIYIKPFCPILLVKAPILNPNNTPDSKS